MPRDESPGLDFLVALLLTPFSMAINGLIFAVMWQWFAVGPLGVPPLRAVDAIGLSVLVDWYLLPLARSSKSGPLTGFAVGVVMRLMVFGIAAVVHAFQ